MRILKEPLLHFFLLGVAIFAWFFVLNPQEERPADPANIVISNQEVERVLLQFQAVWKRPPNSTEFDALIEGMVREEVLVREAEALGLNQNDGMIRKRLVQKMDFLTVSLAQTATPDEEVLRTYMQDNAEKYQSPARIAFEQVYLGEQSNTQNSTEILAQLTAGATPRNLGQRSLLPTTIPLSGATKVNGSFGNGFFEAVSEIDITGWAGPVRSAFGYHLVKITEQTESSQQDFEKIEDILLSDWRREMSQTLSEAQLKSLKDQYTIELPDLTVFQGELLK